MEMVPTGPGALEWVGMLAAAGLLGPAGVPLAFFGGLGSFLLL